ncbi:MAG: CDP-archaeol synthase [Minisyncoccia bacterium]
MIEALWFFLPAFVANQCPGFGAWLRVPGNVPVSRKWLGENKTVAAYYMAAIGSILTFSAQQAMTDINVHYGWIVTSGPFENIGIGLLFGVGAVFGDHLKSFFKRLIGLAPGESWWPFDQLDYVFGTLLFVYPVAGKVESDKFLIIVVVVLVGHPIVNGIGYWIGIRKKWL